MVGHSAAVLFALVSLGAARGEETSTPAFDQWTAGQRFEIRCADQTLRGELVDPSTGQCELTASDDGQHFTAPRTVFVLGTTAGPQARQTLVLMRQIKVGLKLELGVDDLDARNRQLTSEVQSVRLMD